MVKLTAAATVSIPRIVIFALTLVYGLAGLFGRDPWKNEDSIGFGVMWHLHTGSWQDWLAPGLAGRDLSMGAPLPYWLGATFIELFGSWIGDTNAARLYSALCFFTSALAIWYATYLLGRRKEVQPMSFALGGQPNTRDYGMTLADGALLIFLACVGLAQRTHETTPMMAQLMGLSIVLYGTIRGLDKPWQGGAWTGLGLVILGLSSNWALTGFITVATGLSVLICQVRLRFRWTLGSVLIAIIGIGIWPLLWHLFNMSPALQESTLTAWANTPPMHRYIAWNSLQFMGINFWAYAWPVWPLALVSLAHWVRNEDAGSWRAPHLCIPLGLLIAGLVYVLFRVDVNEHDLIVLIPPMAIIAAFSLPILRRNVISFIDWFAMLSFTIIAIAIWVIWFAKTTGYPAATAANVARFIPGFEVQFSWLTLLIALTITALWLWVVQWRTSRAPKVIWRCLIISAAGTTLMWVLLMTLWLPTINYAKTYRFVAQRLVQAVPADAKCIDSSNLGLAQLASFSYFTKLPLSDNPNCPYMLTHNASTAVAFSALNDKKLKLLWEDRRAADRDERLRLYQVLTE
jgi:4-amino-4-deoxy-L-arabinose transferase-like glycosyltransferase